MTPIPTTRPITLYKEVRPPPPPPVGSKRTYSLQYHYSLEIIRNHRKPSAENVDKKEHNPGTTRQRQQTYHKGHAITIK